MSCIAKCTLSRTQTRSPDKERKEHMEHFLLLIDTLKSRWSVSHTAHFLSTHLWPQAYSFQLLQDNKESKRWSAAQKKKRELEFGKFQPFVLAVCNCFSSVVSRRKLRRDFLLLLLLLLQPSSRLVKMFLLCDCAAVFSERASEAHRQMPKGKKAHALKQLESFTCWFVSKQNFRQKKKKVIWRFCWKIQQLSSQYYAHDDLQAVCVLRCDSFFF